MPRHFDVGIMIYILYSWPMPQALCTVSVWIFFQHTFCELVEVKCQRHCGVYICKEIVQY